MVVHLSSSFALEMLTCYVLDAVERGLGETGIGLAKGWVDDHPYHAFRILELQARHPVRSDAGWMGRRDGSFSDSLRLSAPGGSLPVRVRDRGLADRDAPELA
jgi:hypothetical protein